MKKITLLVLLFSISLVTAQPKVYPEKEVDANPGFPDGGWNSWISFVEKNFKWIPEKNAKHIGIEFTIQTNGTVTDIKIINPNGSPNEKEALRVMSLSPKWSPATVKGKAVACRLSRGMFNPYFNDGDGGIGAITIEGPKGDPSPAIPESQEDNTIYNSAGIEVKPEFPGGLQKFYAFLNANFKLPEEEDLNGKIFASFIVEKDGSLSDIKVIRDFGYGTGKELIRVLKMSPKWNPGQQNGKTVRVQYMIPFTIKTESITPTEKK